ncbi:hypothetical protein GT022_05550 [Agaribacter marinus]|uniref:Uncharacterized protein n=1 Tax=Virgibacillus salarius TaxID=447199 RepID=A0A941DUT4_9BACI|nr:hypothetical protein [Virgibacillus salarius]MBR7795509.1 hypothetical protein [Virgibacillus salarius]NAZ08222.1 hypothetical protein [Agaribacter marinus]
MFKYNIGFPILLFVTITLKQFFLNNYINWIDNIGLSILVKMVKKTISMA